MSSVEVETRAGTLECLPSQGGLLVRWNGRILALVSPHEDESVKVHVWGTSSDYASTVVEVLPDFWRAR